MPKTTSILHKTPRITATPKSRLILPFAIVYTYSFAGPVIIPDLTSTSAKITEPTKFPRYTKTQALIIFEKLIFLSITAIVIMVFPVNNSLPVKITSIRPTGKTVAPKNFMSPISMFPMVCPINIYPKPPKPTYAPAIIARSIVFRVVRLAFACEAVIIYFDTSTGLKYLFSKLSSPFIMLLTDKYNYNKKTHEGK